MQLRTRIAMTFMLLLAAVLAAALIAVSAANRANAEREVGRQLDTGTLVFQRVLEANRRQLTQAAQVLAADFGFREAVATRDAETLASALENHGARIGAAIVVLVSLDGVVMANAGSDAMVGQPFAHRELMIAGAGRDGLATVTTEGGRVYQLVMVPVRSPLPVAWIAMGFEIDRASVEELAGVTGLGVSLAVQNGSTWTTPATSLPAAQALAIVRRTAGAARESVPVDTEFVTRQLALSSPVETPIVAVLSRSIREARAPFDRLTQELILIATVSLCLAAIAVYALARNITRPLRWLTAAVEQIRSGQYQTAVPIDRRDELGTLAEGLQLMQAAVETRDQSIRRLAYEDTLTGLMNRLAFTDALTGAIGTAGRGSIAVAIINLQRFRRINECLGYAVGDAVLRAIAERLREGPRLADGIGRLAADHFAAFRRLTPGMEPAGWAASLIGRLAEPVTVESQPIDISGVVGIAVVPVHAATAEDAMRYADLAVERARREKRSIAVYEPTFKSAAHEQLSLLGELQRAVNEDELRLVFQPKIELTTGRVAGAEVLLRWQHPTRGWLGPAEFIPFAEQTGFIRRLSRWMMDHAVACAAAWHRAGSPLALSINISAEDVSDPRLDQRVAGALDRHGLPPELLTLEVTESGFIEDPDRALAMLESLKLLGVRLSIDDFGTGYSSLSYLARMPVDEVKIDRSFIEGLVDDQDLAAVVRSAIDMGHSLGLEVVAEGIETEAAAARLRELGCDIGQGYLYAKPLGETEFLQWLDGRPRVAVTATPRSFQVEDISGSTLIGAYPIAGLR